MREGRRAGGWALTCGLGAHDQGPDSVYCEVDECEEELGEEAHNPAGLKHGGQVDVTAINTLRQGEPEAGERRGQVAGWRAS